MWGEGGQEEAGAGGGVSSVAQQQQPGEGTTLATCCFVAHTRPPRPPDTHDAPPSFPPRRAHHAQVADIGRTDAPALLKNLQRAPLVAQMVGLMLAIFFMPPKDVGSYDLADNQGQLVY